MHLISLFCPCFYGESEQIQIGFTVRFSFGAELGSIVLHHFLNYLSFRCSFVSISTFTTRCSLPGAFRILQRHIAPSAQHIVDTALVETLFEEVMDYGTYCCAIAALVQKPTYCCATSAKPKG